MTDPDTAETSSDWVDPGSMDASIWTRKPPGRAEIWTRRILLLGLLLTPVLIWMSNLWGLPDVGLPKELAEWRAQSTPDEKNAAILYRLAMTAIPPRRLTLTDLTSWTRVSPSDRAWLAESMRGLLVWREATKLPECDSRGSRPETRQLSDAEVALITRLTTLEGLRLENQSRHEEALDLYLALLRFGRHLSRNSLFYERFRSVGVHQVAANRLRPWSDHPNLSVEQLQRALREVMAIEAIEASPTESVVAELDRLERGLDDPDSLDRDLGLDAFNRQSQPQSDWRKRWSRASRWFQSEPERSRRVGRLIFANWLESFLADAFRERRTHLDYPSTLLFRGGMQKPVVSPAFLVSKLDKTRYAQSLLPQMSGFVTTIVEDDRNQRELVQALAERLFVRVNGRRPNSIDEVNPEELLRRP